MENSALESQALRYRLMRELNRILPLSEGEYLNYGMWDRVETTSPPQRMWEYLMNKAEIDSNHRILHVGCGLGECDRLCMELHDPAALVALDINEDHVKAAEKMAESQGLSDRLSFFVCDAMNLDPRMGVDFDRVLALEVVELFNPKLDFFSEAYRILKPGGRLVFGELCVRNEPRNEREKQLLDMQAAFWELENPYYGAEDYRRDLQVAGFEGIEFDSVGQHVFKPLADFIDAHLDEITTIARSHLDEEGVEFFVEMLKTHRYIADLELYEFWIITARKP